MQRENWNLEMSKYFARSLIPFILYLICDPSSVICVDTQKHATRTHVFKESMPLLSSDEMTRFDRVENGSIHEVVFVIRQRNMEDLTRILHDVSDPKSPNYGQHLTQHQVTTMTSNPESRDVVLSYLDSIGSRVTKVTPGGEYIIAEAPITVWEHVFKAEFFTFSQILRNGETLAAVRADAYSVPSELDAHIESVLNIVDIPVFPRLPVLHKSVDSSEFSSFMTPKKIRTTYNIDSTVRGSVNSTQAIFATIGFYFSPNDLRLFQESQGLADQPIARDIGFHVSDSICVTNPGTCSESNLDVQYIMATSPGSPTTFWYDTGFTSWLIAVASDSSLPLVLSISYGSDENRISSASSNAFNVAAVKLSIMGVTILASSGDDGALTSRVRNRNKQYCGYEPDFPASSPYVTAVGATSGPESGTVEVVAQKIITSGGGFSVRNKRPSWQDSAVDGYFVKAAAAGKSPVPGFASTGRGYPDITMAGINYLIYNGGDDIFVSGTSASCPALAGLISNINAGRMALGKGSIGWLNPALYQGGSSFLNDITSGDIKCTGDGTCCDEGFYALPGWDPTSGMGSPNFKRMYNYFLPLGRTTAGLITSGSRSTGSPYTTITAMVLTASLVIAAIW